MRDKLENIVQTLAQEMETTGTIVLDGQAMRKNSLNPSPYAGLCHAAVEKLATLVKDTIPKSRVNRVSFTTINDDAWKRSRHVIAEVATEEGIYFVDPTIKQYMPNAAMIYPEGEQYPLEHYLGSVKRSNIYDNL